MKQEVIPVYKEMEEQMRRIAEKKKKKSDPLCIDGKPMYLPLNGHKIEITYYKAKRKNAPILFGTYVGKFDEDNHNYENMFWKMISEEFQYNVVCISYKDFSECKFPCAINDVYDVICYFMENANEIDFDKDKVMVFGSGIGANFVTAAAMLDRANNTNYIKTQILNYPYLDLTSKKKIGDGSISTDNYVNNEAELKNPFVSPIYASKSELENMPKTIMIYGEEDSLRHEDEKYANMLSNCGTEVYCQKYNEMEHGFVELYFLLKYMPVKSQSLSERMRRNFISGKLYKSVMSSLEFIKKHCL